VPKRLTNKTRLLALIKPGRIIRTDYRSFQFSVHLDFHTAVKHGKRAGSLLNRVRKYLEMRTDTDYNIESVDNTVVLEFAKLDDARMFVLSFNDVIDTDGVKFD
jgi:hypothetical protein